MPSGGSGITHRTKLETSLSLCPPESELLPEPVVPASDSPLPHEASSGDAARSRELAWTPLRAPLADP